MTDKIHVGRQSCRTLMDARTRYMRPIDAAKIPDRSRHMLVVFNQSTFNLLSNIFCLLWDFNDMQIAV